MDFVRFLNHEDLYVWYLRYNICSTWFLDIRIYQLVVINCKFEIQFTK